jgi:ribosomal protein S18 acetylase RimI-like enzyme
MDIREIDQARMPELWQLWVRGLHDHPEAFGAPYEWAKGVTPEQSQEILRQIRANEGFILGAMNEGTLIGELNFNRQQGEKFRHKGDIGAVYVIPEQRGKGIAKVLLLAALEKAQTMTGLAVISLSVNAENQAAIKLYESCGFRSYGIEPKGLRSNGKDYDLMHMTYEVRRD